MSRNKLDKIVFLKQNKKIVSLKKNVLLKYEKIQNCLVSRIEKKN